MFLLLQVDAIDAFFSFDHEIAVLCTRACYAWLTYPLACVLTGTYSVLVGYHT